MKFISWENWSKGIIFLSREKNLWNLLDRIKRRSKMRKNHKKSKNSQWTLRNMTSLFGWLLKKLSAKIVILHRKSSILTSLSQDFMTFWGNWRGKNSLWKWKKLWRKYYLHLTLLNLRNSNKRTRWSNNLNWKYRLEKWRKVA